MSIDEGQVRDAWDRNASLWTERVRLCLYAEDGRLFSK